MMRRRWLALAALAFAAPAGAQFGGRRSRGGGDDSKKGGGDAPQANTLEVTLYELEEDLKLNDAQRPLWDTYADRVRAMISDTARERARAKSVSEMNVLQRMDHLLDVERNRLTAMEDVVQAAKNLWNSLTPDQQHAADPRLASIVFPSASPASAFGRKS